MTQGFRDRLQTALNEANAKAEAMGDDEINARLGPATRAFFAVGERMELGGQKIAIGVGAGALVTVLFGPSGWLGGKALNGAATYGNTATLFVAASIVIGLFFAALTLRQRGIGVSYLGGIFFLLAASAATQGNIEGASLGLGALAAVGLAAILKPVAPPTTATIPAEPPSDAIPDMDTQDHATTGPIEADPMPRA